LKDVLCVPLLCLEEDDGGEVELAGGAEGDGGGPVHIRLTSSLPIPKNFQLKRSTSTEVKSAADMVADMADTVAVRLPATVAVRLPATAAAPGAGADVAAVSVATKRQYPMCPPDRMQDCAILTSTSYYIFFRLFCYNPRI
jgi:hypothetical protein